MPPFTFTFSPKWVHLTCCFFFLTMCFLLDLLLTKSPHSEISAVRLHSEPCDKKNTGLKLVWTGSPLIHLNGAGRLHSGHANMGGSDKITQCSLAKELNQAQLLLQHNMTSPSMALHWPIKYRPACSGGFLSNRDTVFLRFPKNNTVR